MAVKMTVGDITFTEDHELSAKENGEGGTVTPEQKSHKMGCTGHWSAESVFM